MPVTLFIRTYSRNRTQTSPCTLPALAVGVRGRTRTYASIEFPAPALPLGYSHIYAQPELHRSRYARPVRLLRAVRYQIWKVKEKRWVGWWWGWRDSNPHELCSADFKSASSAIPTHPHVKELNIRQLHTNLILRLLVPLHKVYTAASLLILHLRSIILYLRCYRLQSLLIPCHLGHRHDWMHMPLC